MDTSHLEHTAECYIAHELQRNGFLVAKPKFDQNGTDLIALLEVNDGAKFCRIQCKGRTLTNSIKSNVTIPADYVSGSFFCFLYIDTGDKDPYIFCFSVVDIENRWTIKTENRKKIYKINIHKNNFSKEKHKSSLLKFSLNTEKIEYIKYNIEKSISKDEIKLINLVKTIKESLETSKKINELENIISKIENTEKYLTSINKEQKAVSAQYIKMLHKLNAEIPAVFLQKITKSIKERMPVTEIVNQAEGLIPDKIPLEVLADFITFVLLKNKKSSKPQAA